MAAEENGAIRLCVDLKVHINGKFMDKDYPIADYQLELDEDAKEICTINTSQGLFKMCRLPQGPKNSSSIFKNCSE